MNSRNEGPARACRHDGSALPIHPAALAALVAVALSAPLRASAAPPDAGSIEDAVVQVSEVPQAGRDEFAIRGRVSIEPGVDPVADGVANGVTVAAFESAPPTPSTPCSGSRAVASKTFAPGQCKAILGGRSLSCKDTSDSSVFRLRRSSSPTSFGVNAIVRGLDLPASGPLSLPLAGEVKTNAVHWFGWTQESLCRVTLNGARTSCRGRGTSPPPCQGPPLGPVVYEKVAGVFAAPGASSRAARAPVGGNSSGGCGAVMGDVGAGVTAASGFLNFIPVAGPALGAITTAGGGVLSLFGASAGNTCIENQIANINQQLSEQQTQINDIQDQLDLLSNSFYQAYYAGAVAIAGLADQNFQDALQNFTGIPGGTGGLFATFMQDVGLWQNVSPVPGASLQNPSQGTVANASPDEGSQSTFRNSLQSLSGTAYDTSCSSNCYATVTSILEEPGCSTSNPTGCSAIIAAYASLAESLVAAITTCTAADSSACPTQPPNAVPSIDQYNATVVSMYQQAVYAMQQAFTIEYATNQANFFYGLANPAAPVPPGFTENSWGGVPGTFYSPQAGAFDAATESGVYDQAQRQLALMYAARINALYANTLSYLFTDTPIGGQAWPTEAATVVIGGSSTPVPNPIQYASQVGANLSPGAPLDLVQLGGATWRAETALYQYVGLQDVNSCISAVESFNASASAPGLITTALAGGACPSILALPGGGSLDESTLNATTMNPYTSFPAAAGTITLAGFQAGNLSLCGPTGNAAWYVPAPAFIGNLAGLVAGASYLWCDDVDVPSAPDSSSYSPPGSGSQLNMGGTGQNASYQTEDGALKYFGAVVNAFVPTGATSNSSGVYNVDDPTPEGWGFDKVADGPSSALSTLTVTLQGTGQVVTLPFGLFMNDVNGAAILSVNVPTDASLATTGYTCSAGDGLQCAFFDGTTVQLLVISQAELVGQSGWGLFSQSCPNGGC